MSNASYAERSAQAYASYPSNNSSTNYYAHNDTSNYDTSGYHPTTTHNTYAARSAQAYAQQQPVSAAGPYHREDPARSNNTTTAPPPVYYSAAPPIAANYPTMTNVTTTPSKNTGTTGGYAARSAQAYAQQQPPATTTTNTPYAYAQPAVHQGSFPQQQGGTTMEWSSMVQQQQQQQQPPSPTTAVVYPTYPSSTTASTAQPSVTTTSVMHRENQSQAAQQRMLTDATRKVQEHAYYMRQAMEQKNLPVVLDRAAHMVGELGGPPHGHHAAASSAGPVNTGISPKLTPKNYYELYMRALEDIPAFEEYLYNLAQAHDATTIQIVENPYTARRGHYTMRELYDCVQYCPRVLSRLYLQIAAGSALIRSGEVGAKWVLNDLLVSVRCEQNPIRGLFLRNFLLTASRDKLPDDPIAVEEAASLHEEEGEDRQLNVTDEKEKGTVKDSYEFILENFMEMNKLWVRIQHLPGEGNNKDVRKRRERERSELKVLVGTNLVRLSQLENITSKIYGEVILPKILDHVVICGDPLSQAYLMDCLVQAFPDEYHIETLQILLNVCPRLKDKVNIRTILQGLMDRLANYLAEEELLDEDDENQVKMTLARDSFGLFEECVQNVYNARGPKLTSKEVIRLQTAMLQFSVKCYPGNMDQIGRTLGACVAALRQANASYEVLDGTVANVPATIKPLDEMSVTELEKLLSIPLDSLAMRVLELEHFSELLAFLPWKSRREVAMSMLEAMDKTGTTPRNIQEIEQLFSVIEPVIRNESLSPNENMRRDTVGRAADLMAGLGVQQTDSLASQQSFDGTETMMSPETEKENALLSKLVHLLDHDDPDVFYEMLVVARKYLSNGGLHSISQTLASVVVAALKLTRRVFSSQNSEAGVTSISTDEVKTTDEVVSADKDIDAGMKLSTAPEDGSSKEDDVFGVANFDTEKVDETGKSSTTNTETQFVDRNAFHNNRKIFVFIRETISVVATASPEVAVKLYLESVRTADRFYSWSSEYGPIAYELLTQAFSLYEEGLTDSKARYRCVVDFIGTLLSMKSLNTDDYEGLSTKATQCAAKLLKKPDQCEAVALCSHLFYPIAAGDQMSYSNPQRALECLQRSLKLADACTSANASHVGLFVDILEQYLFFFEKKNPAITPGYISGLVALVKEHLKSLDETTSVVEAKAHFAETLRHLRHRKIQEAELFSHVDV